MMAVTCQHNDANLLFPIPSDRAAWRPAPNTVRRTAQRQLAGETVPAASDVQMLPACHVVPRLCFAAIADPHQVRPAGVLPTLPPCG